MEAKPFKDTALGQFVTDKLPDIASKISTIMPSEGVLGIIKNVLADPNALTPADRVQGQIAMDQYNLDMAKEETARYESFNEVEKVQVAQEDRFTKRARPMTQYVMLLILILCYPVAGLIKGKFLDLPSDLITMMGIVLVGYTAARSYEKTKGVEQPNGSLLGQLAQTIKGK